MDFVTCFRLGRALRYGDAESFFGVYDALPERTVEVALSEDQLQYLKELAREISDLSHEDFSLMQTAVQSHPTGSPQSHVLDLTACAASNSSSTCDGPVVGSSTSNGTSTAANNSTSDGNSSGRTAAAKLISTSVGSTSFATAAAAHLREFLDRLRLEVYYSDSGTVSDLDGSVCDGTGTRSRNSSACADTDAAVSTIPSTSTDTEREVVEPSRGDEPEREASISQNHIEVCQQISEMSTDNTASVEGSHSTSTSIEYSEGRQKPTQADLVAKSCVFQICGSQYKIADGPNCEGHKQKLGDAFQSGDSDERKPLSDSYFSQQKPKNKGLSQSKGRRGRRKKRHPQDLGVDRSTVSHYGLQHDGSRRTDTTIEREDAAILALATDVPSEHYHRPSATDSQSPKQAVNTQVQFKNYQEVVQFLGKEWIQVQNELQQHR